MHNTRSLGTAVMLFTLTFLGFIARADVVIAFDTWGKGKANFYAAGREGASWQRMENQALRRIGLSRKDYESGRVMLIRVQKHHNYGYGGIAFGKQTVTGTGWNFIYNNGGRKPVYYKRSTEAAEGARAVKLLRRRLTGDPAKKVTLEVPYGWKDPGHAAVDP